MESSPSLLQAMLAVNDMFYLAVPMVASLFYEDVVAWLLSARKPKQRVMTTIIGRVDAAGGRTLV